MVHLKKLVSSKELHFQLLLKSHQGEVTVNALPSLEVVGPLALTAPDLAPWHLQPRSRGWKDGGYIIISEMLTLLEI